MKILEFIIKYISKIQVKFSILDDGKIQICLVFDPKDIKI